MKFLIPFLLTQVYCFWSFYLYLSGQIGLYLMVLSIVSMVFIFFLILTIRPRSSMMIWRVRYPDGNITIRMTKKIAEGYKNIFGGYVYSDDRSR